jgi:hypothetical protein
MSKQFARNDVDRRGHKYARLFKVRNAGFAVHQLSEHHYRILDRVDFWPGTGRWMDLVTPDQRGEGPKTLIPYLIKLRGSIK